MSAVLELLTALVWWVGLLALTVGGILCAATGWLAWQDRREHRRADAESYDGVLAEIHDLRSLEQ